MTASVFICGGHSRRPCVECGRQTVGACGFELRGRRQGDTCGRALCDECAAQTGGMCVPHAIGAAKTKREAR